jgi:DNA-binding LytR/AlgR family response regulator
MNDGMCYTSEKSMEQIASQLDPKQFMRVNKQFLLARDSVKEITIWFDNRLRVSLTVATPEDVYISKNKSSEFKAWLIN